MRIRLIVAALVLFQFNALLGQSMEKYHQLIKEAEECYKLDEFQNSADKYKLAFDQIEGKAYPYDRYNAACSYALAEDSESAFYHLLRLTRDSDYSFYKTLPTDTDFINLYEDQRWTELLALVNANIEAAEKDLDKALIAILDSIHYEDQTYRKQIGAIEKEFGRDSDEMKAHWEVINEKDAINLVKVTKVLDTRGWLGANIIGEQGNSTLFLVIQHAGIETQTKYLPMMREAAKNGTAKASSLALLEDRVALRQGNRQIYGSQIGRDQETGEYYVSPLVDPENVDARRASVGLGTLAEYVGYWEMTWDIEKHKARTAKIEAKN